jgi:hypothetical protein
VLPDNLDVEASSVEGCDCGVISVKVRLELRLPEFSVGYGQAQSTDRTAMPVAAMDEHGQPCAGKEHVGTTWQRGVDSITAGAEPPKRTSEGYFATRYGPGRTHGPLRVQGACGRR